jgi:hypothetical protein
MNDESGVLTPTFDDSGCDTGNSAETACPSGQSAANIPGYLQDTYWWAYLHPNAVRFWEREWLVNAILWGQMKRLTEAVIEELDMPDHANLLQIACVYGTIQDFTYWTLHQSRLPTHDANSATSKTSPITCRTPANYSSVMKVLNMPCSTFSSTSSLKMCADVRWKKPLE